MDVETSCLGATDTVRSLESYGVDPPPLPMVNEITASDSALASSGTNTSTPTVSLLFDD